MADSNDKLSQTIIDSIESKDLPDIALVIRLASRGASKQTISAALGITDKEYNELLERNDEIVKVFLKCKAATFCDVADNLYRLATTTDDVGAIKLMLGMLGDEYKDQGRAATVNVQNNTINVALPSTKEALAFCQADPSLIVEATETEPS